MTYTVKYRFGSGKWFETLSTSNALEAKREYKRLFNHMKSWDGKLHDCQVKIFKNN